VHNFSHALTCNLLGNSFQHRAGFVWLDVLSCPAYFARNYMPADKYKVDNQDEALLNLEGKRIATPG